MRDRVSWEDSEHPLRKSYSRGGVGESEGDRDRDRERGVEGGRERGRESERESEREREREEVVVCVVCE